LKIQAVATPVEEPRDYLEREVERLRARIRELAESEAQRARADTTAQRLAAIVESSDDAIVSKDLDGVILTWNGGAERIYGYTADEVRGRPMSLLLPPDRPDEETLILDQIKRGERVDHSETVRVRKDGRRIDVSLSISPIRDQDGIVRGVSHVARDISERKALERQLLQTQKLESLGVLAGGVAHDFNNLLTGILGNASLVADSLPPSNPNHRILEECVKAAERAAHLTRQLLAYAGKGQFVIEAVNLSSLVKEISTLVNTSIPRKVQVRLELQPDLPAIEADTGQLQQVIMNLVINAAEAIGDNVGLVVVTTGEQEVNESYSATVWANAELRPGRYVTLEVHDSGSGMDEATLQRIFDPFFTTKFTGRGLGLAAVSGIMRAHKGAMKVYSVPGKGTTFKLLFPVADVVMTSPRHTTLPSVAKGSGTILVVDDEQIVRDTARNTLERYGYRILIAKDGREAVELFREVQEEIALVLLDLTMPYMNGEEVLRELQSIRPRVRVLLSSGFNEVEAVRRFTGKGLAGFIQKPYTSMALAEKIKHVLQP
jgi:two-component system cell cycle sensor histidine kinase/response regulator CckA